MIFSQIVPDTVLYSAPFMLMVAVLLQALTVIFTGPVVGGYYYVFIKTMRGEAASVGDLFAGFQKSFSQLYLGFLINNLLMVLCSVPFYIVWAARSAPVLIHMKHIQNPNELHGQLMDLWSAAASSYPVLLLCLIPIAYLATSLRFVIPLIIDQGMDVWTAIGTSFKMVHRHWFTVFGLVICTGIIWLLGFCLCCIPAIFTVGIATAATMFAYESIFCERRN
jgi:membrane-anchored glycerophosphoryl diester phosphodiesterase (GDPDase)